MYKYHQFAASVPPSHLLTQLIQLITFVDLWIEQVKCKVMRTKLCIGQLNIRNSVNMELIYHLPNELSEWKKSFWCASAGALECFLQMHISCKVLKKVYKPKNVEHFPIEIVRIVQY